MTTPLTVPNDADRDPAHPVPEVREAHDAAEHRILNENPSDQDALLDIALDGSFPTSDAPGHARPGTSGPAPSSGFNERAETAIVRRRKQRATLRSIRGIGVPIVLAGGLITGISLFAAANRKRRELRR
jgi:hypothetical protein